jgi:hypothetical protein
MLIPPPATHFSIFPPHPGLGPRGRLRECTTPNRRILVISTPTGLSKTSLVKVQKQDVKCDRAE